MLSGLIFLPLLMSGVFIFIKSPLVCKKTALCFSILYLLCAASLFFFFDPSSHQLQLMESIPWFPGFGIQYAVGVDGISFWFIILTAGLGPFCVLSGWNQIQNKVAGFYASLFLLKATLAGTFLAVDSVLFYVFFESSLVPMYFIIGIWGGGKRIHAAFTFFIYTAFGSLFLLAGIITLMNFTHIELGRWSASLVDFYLLDFYFSKNNVLNTQNILFLCFLFGFGVKLPMVPFHTWLPLAHVEAPTSGSIMLAAVILKMGAYGFFRFIFPLFPESVQFFSPGLCLWAGVSVLYGVCMALAQTNMKKLVAYSSVSHMAYVVLGLFSLNEYGISGAFYQTLAHGLSSATMFFLVGLLYERTKTLDINEYGGLANRMPLFSIAFIAGSLSVIALPSTGGFIAEFFVLMGAWIAEQWLATGLAVWGAIGSAAYMLYLIHRVFFGKPSETSLVKAYPLSGVENVMVLLLVVFIFVMGLFPHTVLNYSRESLTHLSRKKDNYHLNVKSYMENSTQNKQITPIESSD